MCIVVSVRRPPSWRVLRGELGEEGEREAALLARGDGLGPADRNRNVEGGGECAVLINTYPFCVRGVLLLQ